LIFHTHIWRQKTKTNKQTKQTKKIFSDVRSDSTADTGIGWGLTGINMIALLTMVWLAVWSTRWAKRKWKVMLNRVDVDRDVATDIRAERRERVWQRFWDSLFLFGAAGDDGDDADADGGGGGGGGGGDLDNDNDDDNDEAITEKNRYEEVVLRLLEQKGIASEFGPDAFREALRQPDKEQAAARRYAMQQLEGVDVFWDGDVEDHQGAGRVACTSETGFGKMYIIPFPFRCIVVYDDTRDVAVISDERLQDLVAANRRPDVVAQRQLRLALRALSGQQVFYVHDTKTSTGMMRLAQGELRVMQADPMNPWSHGFTVTITYRTYQRTIVIGHNEIGLASDLRMTPTFAALLRDNRAIIEARLPVVHAEIRDYRQRLARARNKAILSLTWSFWYVVYNNDLIARGTLEDYLAGHEANTIVRGVPKSHGLGLDFLFARLAAFDAHPATAVWFCFWDEFYELNHELKLVIANADMFNPSFLTCIAYHTCARPVLEDTLDQAGCAGLIPERYISLLYERLDQTVADAREVEEDDDAGASGWAGDGGDRNGRISSSSSSSSSNISSASSGSSGSSSSSSSNSSNSSNGRSSRGNSR
jgi:uncharacterized membrane protein YgcG